MLLSNQGTIKLCDFGSATTISHYPDYSWSAQRRALVEEEVSRGGGGGGGVSAGPVLVCSAWKETLSPQRCAVPCEDR